MDSRLVVKNVEVKTTVAYLLAGCLSQMQPSASENETYFRLRAKGSPETWCGLWDVKNPRVGPTWFLIPVRSLLSRWSWWHAQETNRNQQQQGSSAFPSLSGTA